VIDNDGIRQLGFVLCGKRLRFSSSAICPWRCPNGVSIDQRAEAVYLHGVSLSLRRDRRAPSATSSPAFFPQRHALLAMSNLTWCYAGRFTIHVRAAGDKSAAGPIIFAFVINADMGPSRIAVRLRPSFRSGEIFLKSSTTMSRPLMAFLSESYQFVDNL